MAKLHSLSRRSVVASAIAATVPTATAASDGGVGSAELSRLIARVKSADEKCGQLEERLRDLSLEFDERFGQKVEMIPCVLGLMFARGAGREEIKRRMSFEFERRRATLRDCGWTDFGPIGDILEMFDGLEQRNFALVDYAFEGYDRQRELFGIVGVEREVEEAASAFDRDLGAMCSLPCASTVDLAAKVECLADVYGAFDLAPSGAKSALVKSLLPIW